MEFKIVPFAAKISQKDSVETVATQMQAVIDKHVSGGWEYLRMDSVPTNVAGNPGCFGLGATPGSSTFCTVLVFRK
jgi:hypothetical protein